MLTLIAALSLATPASCAGLDIADCAATEHGIVIGAGEDAAEYLTVIDEAAVRFSRYFSAPEQPTAVVIGGQIEPGLNAELQRAGFRPLPWLTNADKRAFAIEQMRSQFEEQLGHLGETMVEQAMAQALPQLDAALPQQSVEKASGALAHEIAHGFLISLWGRPAEARDDGKIGYGSAGPDWLDELAAVTAENDILLDQRREAFPDAWTAEASEEALYPLRDYLSMDHPLLERVAMTREAAREQGSSVRVFSGAEAEELLGESNPVRFYVQSLAFADFLIETSGDETVLGRIALALRVGSFEQYLAVNDDGLPRSVDALEAAWKAWGDARASRIS
ncbi:hypothetical protein [Sphingomicrobium sediminis]|uniref:Uncharacterized protein n=1 Tax=Sphingomicrobium sediminis TaxID=2950949 RepID=A0A9X2EHZ8_9SPHN|nr:hypothetical protein [Sphingomicrobium sediminis]MCM8557856.1 hypothetical protein [Sphingomicrobium sediminis]